MVKQMLDQPSLDRVFHALADPTRRAILERLTLGEAPVSELAAPHEMSLAAIVQHIQILEQSGIIATQKTGRVRTCRIDRQALGAAETWIAERRALWELRLDRLGEILAETQNGE
jgi:DNA-binding transcriptional ArsR family regulator